ncbi:MAG: hypothetical protein ACFFFH_18780 [Candidatus Thorarchaeota archaeon]
MNYSEEVVTLNQLVEGILYILAKPVTLGKLANVLQMEIKEIKSQIESIQMKYSHLKYPYEIKFTQNDSPEKSTVELKISDTGLELLTNYDFFSTQELPTKFYRFMSTILLLEYVKKKRIDKKLLIKEIKTDIPSLEKNLRILTQYGYLKKSKNYYTTSERFLLRMGLPTNKELVTKALKENTIKYALEQFGFKDE